MEIAVLLEDLDILHSMNVPDGPCILDGHNFGFGHRNGKVHLWFEEVNQYRRIINSDRLSSISGRLIQLFSRQCNQVFSFTGYSALVIYMYYVNPLAY